MKLSLRSCAIVVAGVTILASLHANAEPQSLTAERARQRAAFALLDRNGDGLLSDEIPPAQRPWMILSDRNGDGAIDPEEHWRFLNQPGTAVDAPLPESVELHANLPYAGNDHHRQQLDLLLPRKRAAEGPLPVIAYIHGGGWRFGSRLMARPFIAPHVASGRYAAVAVGYRLTDEVSYPAQIHDVKAAVRWVRANAERYALDPTRICAMGESAGGHLAALLGTTNGSAEHAGTLGPTPTLSSDVQCSVDLYGSSDLTQRASKDDATSSSDGPSLLAMFLGAPPASVPERARSASPLHHVDPTDPPFLIIHGTADPLVPYSESVKLNAALKAAGGRSELWTIEGGGHGDFFGPDTLVRIRAFFDEEFARSH